MRHLLIALALALVLEACSTSQPTSATEPAKPSSSSANVAIPAVGIAPLSYAERVRRAVRANIVLVEPVDGNPVAEVEVRTLPDGTIVKVELVRSSGVAYWDRAVQMAIWKTERIPVDVEGKVPPVLRISFRPKFGP